MSTVIAFPQERPAKTEAKRTQRRETTFFVHLGKTCLIANLTHAAVLQNPRLAGRANKR